MIRAMPERKRFFFIDVFPNVFVYLFVCFKYVLYVFVYVCTFWCIYGELEMHRQEGGVTGVYVLCVSYMLVLSGASSGMHLWRCRDRREVRPTSSFLAPPFLLLKPSKPFFCLGLQNLTSISSLVAYIPSFKPAF